MNKTTLLALASIIFLGGCMGKQASISESFRDNFAFTAAENLSNTEVRCVTLTKPFTLVSGAVNFSLPAGKYIARKKNSTGYFYYAPSPIKSSNLFLAGAQEGIYLDNQLNKGNVFGSNPNGFDNRPLRGAVLPSAIFTFIKKLVNCLNA